MAAESWVGRSIANDRYSVQQVLRRGGMGCILLAYDMETQCLVVLKTTKRGLLFDDRIQARFQRETQALVLLQHSHIPTLLGQGTHEGIAFHALPFLAGGSLADRQRLNRQRSLTEFQTWLPAIASALDHVHCKKMLHRDVRPDNVLFDGDGRAYLIDFGLVKTVAMPLPVEEDEEPLTGKFEYLGSAEYAAPEVVVEGVYTAATDQYALAATVYELLTGRTPFPGRSAHEVARLMRMGRPPTVQSLRSDISAGVDKVLFRALASGAAERYADCTLFADAFVQAIG